jgi:hypothetical protein
VLPGDPAELQHQIEFWSQLYREEPFLIPAVDISAEALGGLGVQVFDPSLPVKVICHGFADTGYETWMLAMKEILLDASVSLSISSNKRKNSNKQQ